MPIAGQGWELHIVREMEQCRPTDGRRRTVGRYQVFHDGIARSGSGMTGATAEVQRPWRESASRERSANRGRADTRYGPMSRGHMPRSTTRLRKVQAPNPNPGSAQGAQARGPRFWSILVRGRAQQSHYLHLQPQARHCPHRGHEGLSRPKFPEQKREANCKRLCGYRWRALMITIGQQAKSSVASAVVLRSLICLTHPECLFLSSFGEHRS